MYLRPVLALEQTRLALSQILVGFLDFEIEEKRDPGPPAEA